MSSGVVAHDDIEQRSTAWPPHSAPVSAAVPSTRIAAPSARVAHPREDHLLPLMVAVGAAEGEVAERGYHEQAMGGSVTASSYRFGDAGR